MTWMDLTNDCHDARDKPETREIDGVIWTKDPETSKWHAASLDAELVQLADGGWRGPVPGATFYSMGDAARAAAKFAGPLKGEYVAIRGKEPTETKKHFPVYATNRHAQRAAAFQWAQESVLWRVHWVAANATATYRYIRWGERK